MDWNGMRYVLALSRAGAFAGAARSLRVDESTVRRKLASLEFELGTRLLDRRAGRLALTDAGRDVVAQAAQLDDSIRKLERKVAGGDERIEGRVVLAGEDLVLGSLVVPLLPQFRATCPGVDLELRINNEVPDLVHGEADVAVLLFRSSEATLVERRVGTMAYAVYAAISLLERDQPRRDGALDGMDLVTLDASEPEVEWLRQHAPHSRVVLRTNSHHSLVQAAHAGLGAAALGCVFAEMSPGLVRLVPPCELAPRDVWLVVHPDLQHARRVRKVLGFLAEAFAQLQPRLNGRA
jgi:DNA-binding transcriptional LysR family regulator